MTTSTRAVRPFIVPSPRSPAAATATPRRAGTKPKRLGAAPTPSAAAVSAIAAEENGRTVGPVEDDQVDASMYRTVLTVSQRRRRNRAMPAVLLALGEAEDALEAAIDAHDAAHAGDAADATPDGREVEWRAALGGLSYFIGYFEALLSGYAIGGNRPSTDRERARRRTAFRRGKTHCACPVLWSLHALDAAEAALGQHGPDLLGDPARDAVYQVWALREMRRMFDNADCAHMNEAARAVVRQEMLDSLPVPDMGKKGLAV